jgi:hypothetical protein
MESAWEMVYRSAQLYQANLVEQMLLENNIQAICVNKIDQSYLNFGFAEVYVPKNYVIAASELIQKPGTIWFDDKSST